ncbi:hypothetical protein G4V62_16005 [Bacillaceae bacterium SIJ1]|uniref:hypothetical protein n=1 Tax=Litoribacterium kuwaitense TaxID=1398745 RepID=UPI0013EE234E|nr:hypothetical protein [Litoribacterium kuwaitense]NGP46376.1 hypothetical protein [Litoribacterium kuwaitense]
MARIESSDRTYEADPRWAKLPEGISFGYTHGVVVDEEDNVYVFHTNSPSVVKFNEKGEYLSSWGEQFGEAHGFYLHKEADGEYLYLTDVAKGNVMKTTLDGETVLELETPNLPEVYDEDHEYRPTDVAVAPNGDIYVADGYGQNYVHRYDANGHYMSSFGGLGSEPGQLACPHGISVNLRAEEPELYVADRSNHRIQVFTLDGEHKRFIEENMDMPCSFYFFDGEVYFPDLNSRVTVFDQHDRLVTHLGEDQQAYKQEGWPNLPESYFRDNRFSSPHGVCVDSKGNVYVAEWTVHGRVTKLTKQLEI